MLFLHCAWIIAIPTVLEYLNPIVLLVYKSLHFSAPSYLSDLLHPYSPNRGLRSEETPPSDTLSPAKIEGQANRAFEVANLTLWNKLPLQIRSASALSEFKSCLKTYLFSVAFSL